MKLAIISDTHFGDPMCTLVEKSKKSSEHHIVPKYRRFREIVGTKNDFLILLGDIFDLSISSYAEAYNSAKAFFEQITEDEITKEIIYIPGNHDFELWHWVENQVNVIRKIESGQPPRNFRWSVPGVIDTRSNTNRKGFYLPTVTRQNKQHPYGGLFLDNFTKKQVPPKEPITFNVAYPNLYIVTDSMSILITHGHYFDFYWSLLGEIAPKILGSDLNIGQFLDLTELVAVNFPTNQLASSGIGQAGPLTDCIRFIQRKIKEGDLDAIKKYLNNLDENIIDRLFDYKKYDPRELISDIGINIVKKKLLMMIGKLKDTRYSEEFVNDSAVHEQFKKYYLASMAEIETLNEKYDYNKPSNIPYPKHVIFGHTHQPIPWNDNHLKAIVDGTIVRLHNTGGWLIRQDKQGNKTFVGAEIFLLDNNIIFSKSVH